MRRGTTHPPSAAYWAVHLFIRGDGAEHLLGDLEEEFARRAAAGGRGARRWYVRHAVPTILAWWSPRNLIARRTLGLRAADARMGGRHRAAWGPGVARGALVVVGILIVAGRLLSRGDDTSPLVFVHAIDRHGERYRQFTFPEVEALRTAATSLVDLAGYSVADRMVRRGERDSLAVRVARVSEGFFEALGVPAHLGGMTPRDLRDGAPVAVVSFAFWTGALGGDSTAVGSTIVVSGPFDDAVTIAGVMPPGFAVPDTADLWVPASPWLRRDTDREVSVVARVAHGVTVNQATAQVARLVGRMRSARFGPAGVRSAWVEPVSSALRRAARGTERLVTRPVRRGRRWTL